jgi:hypothetical protein
MKMKMRKKKRSDRKVTPFFGLSCPGATRGIPILRSAPKKIYSKKSKKTY